MLICFQMTNFSGWLEKELKRQNIEPGVLAKRMHKNAGTISRILSGSRKIPDMETLNAIAEALRIPADIVFRAAGANLPVDKNLDPWVEEMDYKISRVPPVLRPIAEKFFDSLIKTEESAESSKLKAKRVGNEK